MLSLEDAIERSLNRSSDSLRNRRWKGVSDLTVRSRLLACKPPHIWKALNATHHTNGELWHCRRWKVAGWGLVRDAKSIDPKLSPLSASAGRPEIRTAMFLRPPYDCRCDAIRLLDPFCNSAPAVRAHEIAECVTHRRSIGAVTFRPGEVGCVFGPKRDDDAARTQLRHSEVRRIKNTKVGYVAQTAQLCE